MLTSRFAQAFLLAERAHGDQIRKGSGVPYITHLMAVSAIIGEYGGDEDQMIAGLLHDVLEDRGHVVSLSQIRGMFGWRVAMIVESCSDTMVKPKPPWEERKRAYLEKLAQESPVVKLVSAADKLHNARALVRDYAEVGEAMWTRFNASKHRQCWYLRGCVVALGQSWDHLIVRELDEIVSELQGMCTAGASEHVRAECQSEV
jgi:GTP pyrophosphokinase